MGKVCLATVEALEAAGSWLYLVLTKFWRRGRLLLEKSSCCWELSGAESPSVLALACGKVCMDEENMEKGLSRDKELWHSSHIPADELCHVRHS